MIELSPHGHPPTLKLSVSYNSEVLCHHHSEAQKYLLVAYNNMSRENFCYMLYEKVDDWSCALYKAKIILNTTGVKS